MARVTNTEASQPVIPAGSSAGKDSRQSGPNDRELVRLAQRGNKEAFEGLVKRHQRKVRPLVYEADFSEEQSRQYQASERPDGRAPDPAARLDARQRVERLLGFLDERDRGMLVLKEVEGFAIEEIAELFDLNTNTVKVRLFRARQRILSQLKKAQGS
jgi:predicted RNA polymerase sigma factor